VAVPPATGDELGVSLGEVVSEGDELGELGEVVSEGDDVAPVVVGETLEATVFGVDEQPANVTKSRTASGGMRRFMVSSSACARCAT
jgi:hypothetical protein